MQERDWKEEEHQYLTFSLGGEVLGINILLIREIIEYEGVTHIPMMPDFIKGVINLRGLAVPVIDLSRRLGRKEVLISKKTCIVVVEISTDLEDNIDIGMIVDGVDEVLELPPDQIEPPPRFGASINTDFIEGMGKIEGKFVVLLNTSAILSMEEITLLEGATEQGSQVMSGQAGS